MRADLSRIKFIVGDENVLMNAPTVPTLGVFSDSVLDFLSDLSKAILTDETIRKYKDVMGFGYWIRRANINNYTDNISRRDNRIGRGVCFHIAPSNIPVQFAVSLVPAILSGNCSVIRCSSKDFRQTEIICDKINDLIDNKYQELKPYICIIKYEHDDEITRWLCSLCDVRIIWGGDKTIENIRKYEIKPRTIDVCFSDRFSIALINGDELLKADIKSIINSFWTDTYYVDQNACSSPRLIIWTGKDTDTARKRFWDELSEKVRREYDLAPIQVSNKLTSFCRLAMRMDGVKLVSDDNYVFRAELNTLDSNFLEYKESGGYFFEYICNDLKELEFIIQDKKCQTIAVYGYETSEIKKIVFNSGARGVDRIVKLGKTTAPGLDWDGFVLIEAMSRYVEVE